MSETATLTLRAATAADRDAYFALFEEVQALHVAARPDLFRPAVNDAAFGAYFADALAQPHKQIVLAWLGEEAVGAIHWESTRLDASDLYLIDRPILWIESLVVSAELRRKGIARALVGLARSVAAEQGIEDIALEVWAFNEDAARTFEALGLTPHARTMLGKTKT